MSNLDQVAALPVGSAADKAALRALLTQRMAYCLADSASLTTINVVDPAAGTIPLAIIQLGRIFWYDAADAITAHDGTTCLVSQDGKRYKVDTFDFPWSVLDKDLTTPPVSPSVGDAYIVGVASTGAWSGHDGAIAVYTAAGWQFITAPIGKFFYVEDETAFYHKNAVGTWTRGVGSLAFAADSIPDSALIGRPIRHIVVNQTTNAPPGAPTTGVRYIIGPSPTGAWSGQAGKLAVCEDGATFTLYTPRTGELAYDVAQSKDYRYSGLAWVVSPSDSAAMILIESKTASASATIDFTAGLDDTYDAYELRFSNVKPATDDVQFWLRLGQGAGPTYATTGYGYAGNMTNVSGNNSQGSSSDSRIALSFTSGSGNGVGNGAGESISGTLSFDNPETTDFMNVRVHAAYISASAGGINNYTGMGLYNTAGGVFTALRFMFSSGNIAAGRFSLYGIRKG